MKSLSTALVWAFTLLPALVASSPTGPLSSRDETSHTLDTRGTAWQARHGMTSASYQSNFDKFVSENYRLTWVSGYTIDDSPRFAALWEQTSGAAWVAKHGLSGADYQKQFNSLTSKGYRLRLVNGYSVAGAARYAAIWDKSAGPAWRARHGLTSSEFQNAFNANLGDGYRLKHISGYSQGQTALYAGIWEMSTDKTAWVAHHGMTSSDYQSKFNKYTSQGYRLVEVSGYAVNNVAYYAAIWDKSPSGPWVAKHGLSSSQYQTEFNAMLSKGYRLKMVSGYTLNHNQDKYAALWIKE